MRIGFGFGLLFATTLFAQGGSVVNPAGGAGTPGVTRSLGSVVNPAQGGLRVTTSGGRKGAPSRSGTVYWYPVYLGGGYYSPYLTPDPAMGTSGPAAPPDASAPPPAQQPVTPVIINYNYNYPTGPPPGPPANVSNQQPRNQEDEDTSGPEPSHYLIAMKDHTIYVATAYWVDGGTLHYFTSGNVHNQVSVAEVDREFTERLNKEAGVDVKIPAPSK